MSPKNRPAAESCTQIRKRQNDQRTAAEVVKRLAAERGGPNAPANREKCGKTEQWQYQPVRSSLSIAFPAHPSAGGSGTRDRPAG